MNLQINQQIVILGTYCRHCFTAETYLSSGIENNNDALNPAAQATLLQRHPCQVINAANDRHSLKKGLCRPFAMTGFCRCGGVLM